MRPQAGEYERRIDEMKIDKYGFAALGATAALFVGGASALADGGKNGGGQSATHCDQLLAKIAEKRGVTPDQLRADIQAKLLARIDAAEKSGKISSERADALRARVTGGNLCRAGKVRHHRAARGLLGAAAAYLGLDREQLRAQLPGTSLVALAGKQGKSEDQLVAAMVAPAKARLAKAVTGGKLSQTQADNALARLQGLATKLAEKVFPAA
jgi:hypothetical protein